MQRASNEVKKFNIAGFIFVLLIMCALFGLSYGFFSLIELIFGQQTTEIFIYSLFGSYFIWVAYKLSNK